MLIIVGHVGLAAGCNSFRSSETTNEKTYDNTGKVVLREKTVQKSSDEKSTTLKGTSVNYVGSAKAVVVSVQEVADGQLTPSAKIGKLSHIVQSGGKYKRPDKNGNGGETGAPTYAISHQSTLWSEFLSIFGFSSTDYDEAYTGVPGESADDTAKRLAACRSTTPPAANK